MGVSAINQLIRIFDKNIFNPITTFMLIFLFTMHITYLVAQTITHYILQSHITRSQSHRYQLKYQKLTSPFGNCGRFRGDIRSHHNWHIPKALAESSHRTFYNVIISKAIFPSTHGHCRSKIFQTPGGRGTTLVACLQDDNKNTDQANILYSVTFEVFQNTLFSYKTFATSVA